MDNPAQDNDELVKLTEVDLNSRTHPMLRSFLAGCPVRPDPDSDLETALILIEQAAGEIERLRTKAPPPEAEMVERVAKIIERELDTILPLCERLENAARAVLSSLGQQRMREALEPFAKAADFKESGYKFEIPDTVYCDVTLGDCRKARQALAEEGE